MTKKKKNLYSEKKTKNGSRQFLTLRNVSLSLNISLFFIRLVVKFVLYSLAAQIVYFVQR